MTGSGSPEQHVPAFFLHLDSDRQEHRTTFVQTFPPAAQCSIALVREMGQDGHFMTVAWEALLPDLGNSGREATYVVWKHLLPFGDNRL